MNKKLIAFLSIIIFVFGYTVFEALRLESKFADQSSIASGTVIKTLPEVKFEVLGSKVKVDPRQFSSQEKYIFIHFWATWCGPCEAEFPELVEMLHLLKGKKNIQFLLVAVNDDVKAIKKFLAKFDLNLDNVSIVEDKLDAHKQFGTYKMPETFLFDPVNTIVKKFTGKQPWSQKYLVEYFQNLKNQ